jgi:RHS repeat-associated protein
VPSLHYPVRLQILICFLASWGTETLNNTKLYYNHNNIPPASPNPSYPSGVSPTPADESSKLYVVNGNSNITGLEFVMKVMAGDRIDILGKSYYLNTTTVTNLNSTTLDLAGLMASLLLAPSDGIAAKGATGSQLVGLNPEIPATFFRGSNSEEPTTVPKAYINYIFLDEQLKYVYGGASRVGSSGVVKDHWSDGLQNLVATKNGYLFVYVSNESNFNVFFDNLQVVHKPGAILEETHYYPFGLIMAGISSKAATFGEPQNEIKFNGIEQNNDFDMNMYDAHYRNFDPQLGRFWQLDPKPSDSISLYAFAFNNPIKYNDPLGDTAILGINNGAALGLGHHVLIYQNKDQNWFVYSMGSTTSADRLVSGQDGTGEVLIKALTPENFSGLPEGPLTSNQVTAFLADNKLGGTKLSDPIVINTTQKQDEQIAANATQSQADFKNGKEKYNLYSNNSTHNTMKVLNNNTGLGLPTGTSPKMTHERVKEHVKLSSMTPAQRVEYRKQWENKVRQEARRPHPGKV